MKKKPLSIGPSFFSLSLFFFLAALSLHCGMQALSLWHMGLAAPQSMRSYFPDQGSNLCPLHCSGGLVAKLCLTLCNLMNCSPLGSSVHEARFLAAGPPWKSLSALLPYTLSASPVASLQCVCGNNIIFVARSSEYEIAAGNLIRYMNLSQFSILLLGKKK